MAATPSDVDALFNVTSWKSPLVRIPIVVDQSVWFVLSLNARTRVMTKLEEIPRRENFPINSNRFLALQYANEDRLKIALSSISNGALV
ncbi:hypothetical protein T02_5981 [Trichinella nativa]|uniref:Uncharacterized protein n=1 Tax=Trichinella nativa TaxID=6335 RepID=A0A0V1KLW9_9BILA|nr:hypothetical protein T02_5981 [Trichinella nativa]